MTLKQGSKIKFDHDFQEVVLGKILVFLMYPPPPPPHTHNIKDVIWQPFCFQNKAKITLRQAFLAIYSLYKSDTACCDILNFRTYQ